MGLFYSATDKELLEIRKKIFLDKGMPGLQKNGFEKSPFSSSWFGKDHTGSYSYEFCKLTEDSFLQIVSVGILRGDKFIQIRLNIFKLNSEIKSLQQLKKVDGMQFNLLPNSLSNMRLHVDDFKGIPLFNYDFMFRNHKLATYFTKRGLKKAAKKLAALIENDLADFNKYIIRWHKIYSPISTTIEGKVEGFSTMTINERLIAFNLSDRFTRARKNDQEDAIRILRWLEVDDLLIKEIVN
jgi:hypothetical protein